MLLISIVLFFLESCSKETPTVSSDTTPSQTLENISYSITSLSCETEGYCIADYSIYNGTEYSIKGEASVILNYICINEGFLRSAICSEEIDLIASYNSQAQGSGFYSSTIICGHDCGTRPFEQIDSGLTLVYERVDN